MSNLIKKKVGPKKLHTKERLIEILMEYTGHYGATPELIKATVEKMYPSDKTKFNFNDFRWGIINHLILIQPSKTIDDLRHFADLYLALSDIAKEEGRDPKPYLDQFNKLYDRIIDLV